MDARRAQGARRALVAIARFYEDPENEEAFRKWKEARQEGAARAKGPEKPAHAA